MNVLIVVNHARDWPFDIDGARVVTAREYLTDPAYAENTSARIINLCRTDRYQGRGYYVSLLAEARGHRALPEVKTLGELSPREIEHDNPEIRRTNEMANFLGQLYNREVEPDDLVTVIRFSQIMTGPVVPGFREGEIF